MTTTEIRTIVPIPDEPFVRVQVTRTAVITFTYWEHVPGSDPDAAQAYVEGNALPPNLDVEIGPMLTPDLQCSWGYRITSGDWSTPESIQAPATLSDITVQPTPAPPTRRPRIPRGRRS